MARETATKTARIEGPNRSGGAPTPRGRGRWIAALVLVALAVLVSSWYRNRSAHRPTGASPRNGAATGWTVASDPIPELATKIETNVARLLAREASDLGATATQAGHVPNLAALLASSIDGVAFQDALSTEPWWKDFRSYGCAVLLGGEVKAVWQLPGSGLPPGELARVLSAGPAAEPPEARLISGPSGVVLGALAPIAGVKGARVLLVEAVDRRRVARLAARANIVMMLSDGRKDLGTSVPDDLVPQLEELLGKEKGHVVVERGLGRLAVAVPWADGVWLWAVAAWQP